MRWLVLLALLLAPGVAQAAPEGPVAVLPFKNLNQNPGSAWMSKGIAETLISDIRRHGKVTVVEREQLDRALSEMSFQAGVGADVSTAAKVGRIVGAKTVVVGGYQEAGTELRITARFVSVETGVVLDAAKATGPTTKIFKLQDEIVSRLLGRKVKRATPPKRAQVKAPKRVEAYKLYAMSLQTATDANRVKLLKKALEIDPDFEYAANDLDSLERRLKDYEALADRALTEKERAFRQLFKDPKADPNKRQAAATQLYSIFVQTGRHRAASVLGREVYNGTWPEDAPYPVRPMGLYWMFAAHISLKQPHQALQVGEQFLKEFPGSMYHPTVTSQMKQIIDGKRRRDEAVVKGDKAIADVETSIIRYEHDRCYEMYKHFAYKDAVKECTAFIARHEKNTDEKVADYVNRARRWVIRSHVELGQFKEARAQTALTQDEEAKDWWPR